jgi:hypothetical protein
MRNEYEVNTCNGVSYWKGNVYVTGTRTNALFETDITSIVLGSVVLFVWLSGVTAYLFTRIREDADKEDGQARMIIY